MSRRSRQKLAAVGVAWFKREQWQLLREVSIDKVELENTYDEWHQMACTRIDELEKTGMKIEKVELDVPEWVKWCDEEAVPYNSSSRANYVAERLRKAEK